MASARPSSSRFRCASLLAATLWLGACAHQPAPPAAPLASWPVQRAVLLAQTQFQFSGRLAVASGADGFSGGIDWRQQAAQSSLQLRGPLGGVYAQIQFDGQTLDLRLSDGSELRGPAAQAALTHSLGFDVPLASLAYWLRGCDDPASHADTTLDEMNRLAGLAQQGWQISYEGYQRQGALWLPRQVTLRRDPVRLRLLIQSWTLPG
jgi:outer membrane lipoprotein LolB